MKTPTLIASLLIATSTTVAAQHPTTLQIDGAVPQPMSLTTSDLAQMPRVKLTASAHDTGGEYEGVAVREVLTRAGVAAR